MTAETSLAQDTSNERAAPEHNPQRSKLGGGAKAAGLGLAVLGGLCVGLLVQTWQSSDSAASVWMRVSQWAGGTSPSAPVVFTPTLVPVQLQSLVLGGAAAGVSAHRPGGLARGLEATVLVGDQRHNADHGPVALSAGSRFQLSVFANRAGKLEIYAINPKGAVGDRPLWSTYLRTGETELSPRLRLDGTRGLETLNLVLRGPRGEMQDEVRVQVLHI